MSSRLVKRLPSESSILRAFFALRGLMLFASLGAILAAVLMFWQGGLHLLHAFEILLGSAGPRGTKALAEGAAAGVTKTNVVVPVLETGKARVEP